MSNSLIIPIALALVAILAYTIYSFIVSQKREAQEKLEKERQEQEAQQEKQQKRKPAKKDITAGLRRSSDASKPKEEEHKEMALQLKGHQNHITGFMFSTTGKHVATTSEDGTIRIWTLSDLVTRNIPFVTIKCSYDYATAVALSGDATRLVAAMNHSKELHVYELTHDPSSHRITSELIKSIKTPYKDVITSLAITQDGTAVVTCAQGTDTTCYVYGVKGSNAGTLIHTITTAQIINYSVNGSPDGRFVAFATKLSDVKIYELSRKKTSDISSVDLVMTLKGHKRAVKGVAFGPGNELAGTASVDGSWRIFGINVRYGQAEDPKLKLVQQTEFPSLDLIAISPNPKQPVIAVTHDTTLAFYHSTTGVLLSTIPHVQKANVTQLTFHPQGTHVAVSSVQTNTVNFFKVPVV